jgi:MFS family permease
MKTQTMQKKRFRQSVPVIAICALFLFIKYIAQLFPSLIGPALIKDFSLTGLQLGLLASSYYYSYSIMQIISGWILDRFSMRFAASLAIGLIGLSLFYFPQMHSFLMMCFFRVLMGLGASFATVLYMKSAALMTSERTFGMVSSFLATVAMLGAAAGGSPLAYLFHSLGGWEKGLEVLGIGTIILSLLCLVFFSGIDAHPDPEALSPHEASKPELKKLSIVFLNLQNWLLLAYSGLAFSPVIIIGGVWGTPFLILKYHLSIPMISYLLSLMFLGLAVGAPCWAYISMKTCQRKSIMQLANAMAFICMATVIYAPLSYSLSMFFFFFLGFSVGCFMLSFQVCKEINPMIILGFSFAFMNTGEGIVGAILEPLVGKILDLLKPLNQPFTLDNFYWALTLVLLCFVWAGIFLHFLKTNSQKNI